MSKTGLWVVAGIAVLTLLYLVYLAATFEAPEGTTTVAIPTPIQQPVLRDTPVPVRPTVPSQPDAAIASTTPDIAPAPVEVEPPVATPVVDLPSLNDSDEFVLTGLRAVQNGVALIRLMTNEQFVRTFVVFVDNVSRGSFPQTALPYRPIGAEMPVSNIDDNLFVMDAGAHRRFDQFINTFVALDTNQAMTLYRTLSPLFQQAYAEIGFRDVNFDDTMRTAINRVLSASDVDGPYQLVKPSVMFLYADSSLENLSAVRKQLIRIGPDNSDKLKAKLRQFMMQL